MNHIKNNVLKNILKNPSFGNNGKVEILDIKKIIKKGWRNAFVDLLIRDAGISVSDEAYSYMLKGYRYFIIDDEIDKMSLRCLESFDDSIATTLTIWLGDKDITTYKISHYTHKSSNNGENEPSIWHIWMAKKRLNIAEFFEKIMYKRVNC